MQLKDFSGKTMVLDAVDFSTASSRWGASFADCSVCNFRLDGVSYSAIENPDDGYRSCMEELEVADNVAMNNVFEPVPVRCSYGGVDDILKLIDAVTGKVILEVGTIDKEDFYPCYVANYSPENMAVNRRPSGGLNMSTAFSKLKAELQRDDDYARAWHDNIAMSCYDAMRASDDVLHERAHVIGNEAAANFMKLCFDIDTTGGE